MAINFYDYVSSYDFVPFAELQSNDDFKVISSKKSSLISTAIKEVYKKKSEVTIEFKPETIKKEKTILKFKLQKAHQYASDPDGYLRYKLTAVNGQVFVSNHNKKEVEHDLGVKRYDDIVEIVFSKNLMQSVKYIDFYYKENSDDWFDFKGNLPASWEHCGRVTIGAGSTCYCNRDFTEEEMREIVKELKENTFYSAKDPITKENKQYPITNLPYHSINKIFHRNGNSGKFKNEEVIDNSFKTFTKSLNTIFTKYEINTCRLKIHFLSQIYIETLFFSQTIETDNNYTKRYDPYRGRGFIHLTWEGNYKKYKKDNNVDIVSNYSSVAKDLFVAADTAGWYWRKGSSKGDINKVANRGTVEEVTPYVNALSFNLKERKDAFNILIKILKYENCNNKK